jgi:glutathione synthase/RimK-type ligase-like ATP-grasp enzyme
LRVLNILQQRNASVLLFDPGAFPRRITLDSSFVEASWQGTFCYEEQHIALEQIKSIWVRRPTHYQVDPEAPELIQVFLENEALKGFGGILRTLPVFWMNDFDCQRAANFKPRQLQVAAGAGLRVPRSLITNDPQAVLRFYCECDENIILKPLHGGGIAGGGRVTHTIYTSRVTKQSLEQIEQVRLTSHYFQEYVEKQVELRITVIGSTVLTVAIHSQEHAPAAVDWRAGYGSELRHSRYTLPPAIEQQCLQVTQQLGLTFGAIDMIVTPKGEFVFLEINPGGQYEWITRCRRLSRDYEGTYSSSESFI